jgi:hypothetical protein
MLSKRKRLFYLLQEYSDIKINSFNKVIVNKVKDMIRSSLDLYFMPNHINANEQHIVWVNRFLRTRD